VIDRMIIGSVPTTRIMKSGMTTIISKVSPIFVKIFFIPYAYYTGVIMVVLILPRGYPDIWQLTTRTVEFTIKLCITPC
jgi:hypothetical protein